MIAEYWDEGKGGSQEVHVPDWDSFIRMIDNIKPDPIDPELLPAILLSGGDGYTCLLVRTQHQGCTVAISENDPDGKLSWPAEFDEDCPDSVQYDYFGSFTEIPASVMIPCETAMRAVRAFIETGSIPSSLIEFVPEY